MKEWRVNERAGGVRRKMWVVSVSDEEGSGFHVVKYQYRLSTLSQKSSRVEKINRGNKWVNFWVRDWRDISCEDQKKTEKSMKGRKNPEIRIIKTEERGVWKRPDVWKSRRVHTTKTLDIEVGPRKKYHFIPYRLTSIIKVNYPFMWSVNSGFEWVNHQWSRIY